MIRAKTKTAAIISSVAQIRMFPLFPELSPFVPQSSVIGLKLFEELSKVCIASASLSALVYRIECRASLDAVDLIFRLGANCGFCVEHQTTPMCPQFISHFHVRMEMFSSAPYVSVLLPIICFSAPVRFFFLEQKSPPRGETATNLAFDLCAGSQFKAYACPLESSGRPCSRDARLQMSRFLQGSQLIFF